LLLNFPTARQSCCLTYTKTIRPANHLGDMRTLVRK